MIATQIQLTEPLDIITEKEFQATVRRLAEELGWLVVGATWNSKNSPSGEPDLRLVRERVVWMELKSEKGRLTSHQKSVVCRLKEAGAEVYVFRPRHWDMILEVLMYRQGRLC